MNLHVRHARFRIDDGIAPRQLRRFVLGVRHQLAQRFAQAAG